jgi:hypothetical protein
MQTQSILKYTNAKIPFDPRWQNCYFLVEAGGEFAVPFVVETPEGLHMERLRVVAEGGVDISAVRRWEGVVLVPGPGGIL